MLWRDVLLWCVGTRRQLDRWERLLAEVLHLDLNEQAKPDRLWWELQIERHFLLVAADNLRRALDRAGPACSLDSSLAEDLRLLRNLHEHWDQQQDVFSDPANPGPLKMSAVDFVRRHPGKSPYGFFNWSSKVGPQVGPGVLASALRTTLDHVESESVVHTPDLTRFLSNHPPSPWYGNEAPDDPWWPKPPIEDG